MVEHSQQGFEFIVLLKYCDKLTELIIDDIFEYFTNVAIEDVDYFLVIEISK